MRKQEIVLVKNQQIPDDISVSIENLNKLMSLDPTRVIREAEFLQEQAAAHSVAIGVEAQLEMQFLCARACYYVNDFQRMDQYIDQTRRLSTQLGRTEDRVLFLGNFAVYLHSCQRHDEAINYAEQAVALAEENGMDEMTMTKALRLLGHAHYMLGRYDVSLVYYERIQRIRENHPNLGEDVIILREIANLYMKMGRSKEADQYFQKSVSFSRIQNKLLQLAYTLSSMGEFYLHMGQVDCALQCVIESDSLAQICKVHRLTNQNTVLIARIRIHRNELSPAQQMMVRLLDNTENSGYCDDIKVECLLQLGLLLQRQGNYAAARNFFTRMMHVAVDTGLHRELIDAYRLLWRLEEQCGNYDRALQFFNLATQQQYKSDTIAPPTPMEDPTIRWILGRVSMSAYSKNVRFNGKKSSNGSKPAIDPTDGSYTFFVDLKRKLLNIANDLTATELRICLLIAYGLLSKEIADLFANSIETINTHRKRIRRKLRLAPGQSLAQYFDSL